MAQRPSLDWSAPARSPRGPRIRPEYLQAVDRYEHARASQRAAELDLPADLDPTDPHRAVLLGERALDADEEARRAMKALRWAAHRRYVITHPLITLIGWLVIGLSLLGVVVVVTFSGWLAGWL